MHRGVYPTASGMHCLWDQAAFAGVCDYDSWERELLNDADIERHIAAGHLVPLNIGSDGVMEVEVRVCWRRRESVALGGRDGGMKV